MACAEFYVLVSAVCESELLEVRAKKAHSVAALLFLAFPRRLLCKDGEIMFKTLIIEMFLSQAIKTNLADISRWKQELARYSVLSRTLFRERTKLPSSEADLILVENAMITYTAQEALAWGIATGLVQSLGEA